MKRALPAPDNTLGAKQEPEGRFWITGKGVRAMRTRLGLTQKQFAGLAGVSSQAVVNWEGAQGKVNLRKAAAGKLQEIRGLKKRDVAGILGKGGKARKAGAGKGKAVARKTKGRSKAKRRSS